MDQREEQPPEGAEQAPPDEPEVRGVRGRLGDIAGTAVGSVSGAVVGGVDPDQVLERVDVNRLLDRVDVNRVLDRVEVDRLLDRADVNRLLQRVDVNALLDEADIDRLLERVDVDQIAARIDLEELLRRAKVPELVADSTSQVAGSLIDIVRRQAVGLDAVLMRAVLRVLRRDPASMPAGPPELVGEEATPAAVADGEQYAVTGRYAGPLTRLAANAADVAAALSSYTLASAGIAYILVLVLGLDVDPGEQAGPVWFTGLVAYLFTYGWLSFAIAGRTPAMMVLGLRVVTRGGEPLSARQATLRVLTLPLSTLVLGLGYLGLVLDRERRTLHDLVAGTTVVYDWGGRTASLPTPLGRWLERQDGSG
jgi:uncharacterized RDD family membrane protein YckC